MVYLQGQGQGGHHASIHGQGSTDQSHPGPTFLGEFIGSVDSKENWLDQKVADWSEAAQTLEKIAAKYPQTAYARFVLCLQNEWWYVSRVCVDIAPFFQPLEVYIQKYFCSALIGIGAHEIDAVYRELLSQSVKKGGLEIRNPLYLSAHVLATSKAAMKHLVLLLVDNERDFDHNSHRVMVTLSGNASSN